MDKVYKLGVTPHGITETEYAIIKETPKQFQIRRTGDHPYQYGKQTLNKSKLNMPIPHNMMRHSWVYWALDPIVKAEAHQLINLVLDSLNERAKKLLETKKVFLDKVANYEEMKK